MSTEGSGASSTSRGPSRNEDAYLVHDGLGLYVVCDGSSEGPAGEVAARTALETLEAFVSEGESTKGLSFLEALWARNTAFQAVTEAMNAVLTAAEEHPEIDGMATTVTMMLAYRNRAALCHVGDSRAYRLRGGRLRQLTRDHDLSASAWQRSVDVYDDVHLECFSIELREGDVIMLCTDGAEEVVEEPWVREEAPLLAPKALASRIIAAARTTSPDTDATVVVVRVQDEEDNGWLLHSQPVSPWDRGYALMAV